jgi:hypothetical protein
MDFINELNSSSYSDLSDPDLTDTELEFIEKENFAKQSGGVHRGSFSRSQSMNMTKNNSLEEPDEMKFEYETTRLETEPHVVFNSKGWHWISSIKGELLSLLIEACSDLYLLSR